MGAMRLIPAPESAKKQIMSYGVLLNRVLATRFIRAMRYALLLSIILTPFVHITAINPEKSKDIFDQTLKMLLATAVFAVTAVALLVVRKMRVQTTYAPASFAALEWYEAIVTKKSFALLGFHISTALAYTFISFPPTLRLVSYVSARDVIQGSLQGLPAEFREPAKLRLLNDRVVVHMGFICCLSAVYTALHVVLHRDLLKIKTRAVPLHKLAVVAIWRSIGLVWTIGIAWPLFHFVFLRLPVRWALSCVHPKLVELAAAKAASVDLNTLISLPLNFTLLVVLWELCNTLFSVYMSLPPYQRKQLVSDASPDPDGSLLEGLSAPETSLKAIMAWYELLIIGRDVQNRRSTIYRGNADSIPWEQIYKLYRSIVLDSTKSLQPPPPKKPAAEQSNAVVDPSREQNRIQAKSDAPIFVENRESIALQFVKRLWDHSGETERQANALKQAGQRIIASIHGRYLSLVKRVLSTSLGQPFRHTTERAAALLLKDSDLVEVVLEAVAVLIAHSVDEDIVGTVQSNIAETLGDLDALLEVLDARIKDFPVHWTDVLVASGAEPPNPRALLNLRDTAQGAFDTISKVFSPFFDNLGVSPKVRQRSRVIADEAWVEVP